VDGRAEVTVRLPPSQALAGAGAIAGAAGLWWSDTPLGALLWSLALFAACVGYGDQLARVVGDRLTIGASAATGLACLIAGSTLLAAAGGLSRPVELALVGLGIALCAIGRRGDPARAIATDRRLLVFAALAGALLVGSRLTGGSPWVTDGANHAMAIKRLWDTRVLGALPGQAGGLVVGESYLALIGGPDTAGAFDNGLCAALVVLLLASELADRRDGVALAGFAALTIPILLNPEPTTASVARWSGTLFHLASWFALQRAIADRRPAGCLVACALALIALRWEFAVLALPYLATGLLLTRDAPPRAATWGTLAAWLIAVTALGPVSPLGVVRAVALTAIAGLASAVIVPVISGLPRRSALGALVFAAVAASLTSSLGVVAPSAHGAAQPWVLWFTVAAAVCSLSSDRLHLGEASPRIRLAVAAVAFTAMIARLTLSPNFNDARRFRMRDRLVDAIAELQFTATRGYDRHQDQAAAQLQRAVPRGAPLGLWGMSAGGLDYTRNPIADLSWSRGEFLAPVSRPALRGVRYLIVEGVGSPALAAARIHDPWGVGQLPALHNVEHELVLLATEGTTRLYRLD
jgi:hypothetical protein